MNAPIDPVSLEELKSVLDRDLAAPLSSGLLSPAKHGGIVIGVLHHGKRLVLTYGEGHADGIYEIGSITKTFTGLLFAQLVGQGKVCLDTPVRALLPAGTVSQPASGREITLLDLSTHRSGLPRLPAKFAPADRSAPYADFDVEKLYACIKANGVHVPPDAPFLYSNLGTGLLGQALSNLTGTPYAALLREQITDPLHLQETVIDLPKDLRRRFVQGYNAQHHPASAWNMNVLVGAGGIRSSVHDMLTYLGAQLHPDRLQTSGTVSQAAHTLPASISATHKVYAEAVPGMHIGLNWLINASGSAYWHNGGTGGFSSFARFNPNNDYAIVVLCNTAAYRFSDAMASHIAQRLMGEPAIVMDNW